MIKNNEKVSKLLIELSNNTDQSAVRGLIESNGLIEYEEELVELSKQLHMLDEKTLPFFADDHLPEALKFNDRKTEYVFNRPYVCNYKNIIKLCIKKNDGNLYCIDDHSILCNFNDDSLVRFQVSKSKFKNIDWNDANVVHSKFFEYDDCRRNKKSLTLKKIDFLIEELFALKKHI